MNQKGLLLFAITLKSIKTCLRIEWNFKNNGAVLLFKTILWH